MERKFQQAYYSDQGFFIGKSAPRRLAEMTHQTVRDAEKWLSKQAVFQVYFTTVRKIQRPHFSIYKPNEAHQADLIFLPNDNGYKYALTVIDVASRFKAARALKSKNSVDVAAAFSDIYAEGRLVFPHKLMTDPGKEFQGAVKALMDKNGTKIRYGRVNIHRDQALVERFNRTLAVKLFTYQTAKELKLQSGQYNREWAKRLAPIVESLNNEVSRSINQKPVDAIKKKEVIPVIPTDSHSFPELPGFPAPEILTDEYVRFMYSPGELEKDTRRRATDPTFSLDVHKIKSRFYSDDNKDYYFLSQEFNPKAPTRSFVRAELLAIPEDTEIF
jgi:transposase InsO family protein